MLWLKAFHVVSVISWFAALQGIASREIGGVAVVAHTREASACFG